MIESKKMIKVTVGGETIELPSGTTFSEIANRFVGRVDQLRSEKGHISEIADRLSEKASHAILLVKEERSKPDGRSTEEGSKPDGHSAEECSKLQELSKKIMGDCSIEFVTMADKEGRDTYKRSLCLLMLKAFDNVLGGKPVHIWIRFTVSGGLFCTLEDDSVELTQELLDKVKAEMESLRDRAIPIKKKSMSTEDAISLFRASHMTDKADLFRYRISSRTNVYSLDGYTDYYFGYMVPDTSLLRLFDLKLYRGGFVLLFPSAEDPESLPPFRPVEKLFDVQYSSRVWGKKLGIHSVGDLDDLIASGGTTDLVLMQEALQEKMIADIAEEIENRKSVKIVFIAGPSSSSKTTFSHRLSIQLSCYGLKPHPIAMDNYFKNRDQSPRNPDGTYNFECLEALDVEQFNKDMTDLMAGREVSMPSYNFISGTREYKGNTLKLSDRDVLVIEGIHGLNDAFSYSIPAESKFKIYISALTQLNIDEHNRIPTTDGRLLRRIVRDARTRGYNAKDTIAIWKSVRRGEEQYIFPFQESADVMFNSALVYELAVLKTYAQPLLHAVPKDCPEWGEAKRLLKFLDYFLPIPADGIPKNSLVREFIGGGCFDV